MNGETTKKKNFFSAIMWIMILASLAMSATGTNVDELVSKFTGTLEVEPVDASIGFTVDQDYDETGVFIDSEATTSSSYALDVSTGQGASVARFIYGTEDQGIALFATDPGTAWVMKLDRNLPSADTATSVAYMVQDHVGDDQSVLELENLGTGFALEIDQNGNESALYLDQATNYKPVVSFGWTDGGCEPGDAGLYTNSGNIYWCRDGVVTQLN